MLGDSCGIKVKATRFGNFTVVIVDARDDVSLEYGPEYVHICSLDKLIDDSMDVFYTYDENNDPCVFVDNGDSLKDFEMEMVAGGGHGEGNTM